MFSLTQTGMEGVSVYQFEITARVRELVSFGAQPGAQLRGALYNALSRQFCSETGFEHTPGHHSRCPVCWLLANENAENERGRDLPRPLILQPPLESTLIPAGQTFRFGVGLVGEKAFGAFKFVIRALEAVGKEGVGFGRGRFWLEAVRIVQPFSGHDVPLLKEGRLSLPPDLPIQQAHIVARVAELPTDQVVLCFLTPLRIGEQSHLVHQPVLGVLLRRLVERCQAMAAHYGDQAAYDPAMWRGLYQRLGEVGDAARLVRNETRWLDVQSGSRRRGTTSPIGGLVGTAVWEGDLGPALPWLLWGQVLHVGKSTVKGNGWYIVETA
jgi:hypothetical protein